MTEVVSEPSVLASPAPIRRSLKHRAFQAGSWVLIGHFSVLVLRLAGNLVMTRLLVPEVFGIMAVATVIQVVTNLLADIGLQQAIIQNPRGGERRFLDTAWTVQVLRGGMIWIACLVVAIALYVARMWGLLPTDSVYGQPILAAVIAVASFSSILSGFRTMKAITANRNLDLKHLTFIELISQGTGLVVAALLGWLTHSIWSFVSAGLVTPALGAILCLLWLPGPTDWFAWDRAALLELVRYGRWVFLSSAIGVLAMNADRLLLGAWVSPTVLGYYSIAFGLATVFDGVARRLFSAVSMPALSEVARHQPHRFPAVYFRMRWLADTVLVAIAGFLFAAGDSIVALIYDPRYRSAGEMLRVLSFFLVFSRYSLAVVAYLALGRPSYLTAINLSKLISLFILVPALFYEFGLQGAIWGIVLQSAPALLWIFWFNHRHRLNNFHLELTVLATWPIGWFIGFVFATAIRGLHVH